jgi:hypothetical protein
MSKKPFALSTAGFQPASLEEAMRVSEVLSKSALMPDALRGKPGDVLVIMLTGKELGLSPMEAIRGINVIKGKASLSGDLTVALVKRHPDCVRFKLVKSDDKVATYETERRGEGVTQMSFTIEQAQRARLGGDNWQKFPAAMLRHRCATALARAVYPDLMLGVYEKDELEPQEYDVGGERVDTVTGEIRTRELLAARTSKDEVLDALTEPPPPTDADAPFGEDYSRLETDEDFSQAMEDAGSFLALTDITLAFTKKREGKKAGPELRKVYKRRAAELKGR